MPDISHHTKYSAKLPYPKPMVEGKNPYYASILLEDYAGVISELTAVTLYTFQHIEGKRDYSDYGEMIADISIAEMKHLELLGETIILLGVTPMFRSSEFTHKNFWSAQYVDYDTQILDMLKIDIESEQSAIRNYKHHLNLIKDKFIKELIERIILDEETHLSHFRDLYSKYQGRNKH